MRPGARLRLTWDRLNDAGSRVLGNLLLGTVGLSVVYGLYEWNPAALWLVGVGVGTLTVLYVVVLVIASAWRVGTERPHV